MPGPVSALPASVSIPLQAPNARKARRAMRLVWGAVACSVLALLLAAAGLEHNQRPAVRAVGPSVATEVAAERPVAETVLERWLDGKPSPIPVAQGLGYYLGRYSSYRAAWRQTHGIATSPSPPTPPAIPYSMILALPGSVQTITTNGQIIREVMEPFLVKTHLTPQGQLEKIVITLGVSRAGVQVMGWPTELAWVDTAGPTTQAVFPGQPAGQLPGSLRRQILAWAAAWAAGDSQALYQISGATSAVHFVGLGGWKVQSLRAVSVAAHRGGLESVYVQCVLEATGDPMVTQADQLQLLLGGLQNAYPAVEAWGPVSAHLQPYANALPGLAGA